jgi:uncharacterized membrane protein HdeD (DUF308 family)
VASDTLPGRLVLGLRAMLAILFGLTGLFMVVLAVFMPRGTALLIVHFFAGFALLDGLLCLVAAARALRRPLARACMALEGLAEVATAVTTVVLIRGEPPHGVLFTLALWAMATGVLELGWSYAVDVRRGRPALVATASISVIFGLFILVLPPADLPTAVWRLAVFVLLLGVLRVLVTVRLQGPTAGPGGSSRVR